MVVLVQRPELVGGDSLVVDTTKRIVQSLFKILFPNGMLPLLPFLPHIGENVALVLCGRYAEALLSK
jgi:hypothetical protein